MSAELVRSGPSPRSLEQSPRSLEQSPRSLEQSPRLLERSPRLLEPSPRLLELTPWRHHEPGVLDLPGLRLEPVTVPVPVGEPSGDVRRAAAELFHQGGRRVRLEPDVDLSGEEGDADTVVTALLLVSELTSWGLVVDWEVRFGSEPAIWQSLSHLFPPCAVLGVTATEAEEIETTWRKVHYPCKCVYRLGPGFVQVRDRRTSGSLAQFTLDDPDYLAAVEVLSAGCRRDVVPTAVMDHLVGENLVGFAGGLAWWLPYRVKRWPDPAVVV